MKLLPIGVNGRYGLYFQRIRFFLKDGSVYCVVGDIGMQQCYGIERLHNVRAVGTGQRHISLQMDWALQCLDAAADTLEVDVGGHMLKLPVLRPARESYGRRIAEIEKDHGYEEP